MTRRDGGTSGDGMTRLRIAELAERTGVPATTLRYYEQIGLVRPADRDANGYRAYHRDDVDRFRFVARARRLSIGLTDLRELVASWDAGRCAAVRHRMAEQLAGRTGEIHRRSAELLALAGRLQAAAEQLAGPADRNRDRGACDGDCPCVSDATGDAATDSAADAATGTGPGGSGPDGAVRGPDSCTLDATAARQRIAEWRIMVRQSTSRTTVAGGVALTFTNQPALVAELARLCAAEQACCGFFRFALTIDAGGVRLEVRAPGEHSQALHEVFGTGVFA